MSRRAGQPGGDHVAIASAAATSFRVVVEAADGEEPRNNPGSTAVVDFGWGNRCVRWRMIRT